MNFIQTILTTAIIIEIITLIGRFGLNISTKHIWIKTMKHLGFKHWFHFHHIFLGIIVFVIATINRSPFYSSIGIGIALSDVVHHTLLSFFIGNPEFHIIYKISDTKGKRKIRQHLIHKITEQSIQK